MIERFDEKCKGCKYDSNDDDDGYFCMCCILMKKFVPHIEKTKEEDNNG